MQELKELVELLFDYTMTISISETELYSNYYDFISEPYRTMYEENGTIDNVVWKMVKADILYDLLFDIDKIKCQLDTDLHSVWEVDTYEYNQIIEIYKSIRKVFKDFYIEELGEL